MPIYLLLTDYILAIMLGACYLFRWITVYILATFIHCYFIK
nr:MAG TPA: hypothetical protein [Caudoviricetes sp.]